MPGAGRPLSDKQMLPEIAALFFAGIDTTGHTGTWSLYMISQHPKACTWHASALLHILDDT